MISLTKDFQQKDSSISESYSRGGDCDYSKSRERYKNTKQYLLVLLGLFVRFRFRGYDNQISRERLCQIGLGLGLGLGLLLPNF